MDEGDEALGYGEDVDAALLDAVMAGRGALAAHLDLAWGIEHPTDDDLRDAVDLAETQLELVDDARFSDVAAELLPAIAGIRARLAPPAAA